MKIREKFLDIAEEFLSKRRTRKMEKVYNGVLEINLNKKIGINDQKEFLERDIAKQFKYYQSRGYTKKVFNK